MNTVADVPLAPAMRRLLLLAAVLVFLAGLQLYLFPLRTADWFAWTIDAPMTAVFLGASYWSSAVLEVAGARARDWNEARLAVWTVLVFTTLTLVVTLVHLDKFHLGAENPTSARVVTVGWLAVYAVVPVVMVTLAWLQTRQARTVGARSRARRRPPAGLRALLVAIAVVLLGLGVALLLVPVEAARLWPWPLTELTARAVGAWLVGLGWAAGHARLIDDLPSIRPLGFTGSAFVVLQGVALVRHGDALDWSGAPAVGYLVGLAAIGVVSVWILALGRVTAADAGASASPR
ncbi:hypothetical protein [Nocardioides sp. GXQ0305]|uniref:hypothetical protein n=1 Tax=Nocardioides sp. GXQ0305 TaxID=3423912 RepID=UPI003D7EE222